jgi:hypothetical protein
MSARRLAALMFPPDPGAGEVAKRLAEVEALLPEIRD